MQDINEILKQDFHDACGIGFVAELSAIPSRRVIDLSIEALKNMSRRGASGTDERTGDGTGLLTDIPKEYFSLVLEEELNTKIEDEKLGIAMVFTTVKDLTELEKKFKKK